MPPALGAQALSKAVVDSGPLFSALTLVHVDFGRVPEPKRTDLLRRALEVYLRDLHLQKLFLQLFTSIRTLLTTSHVVGELQGLCNSRLKLRNEYDRKAFWLHSMLFLKQWNFDERLMAILELYKDSSSREGVCHIGPTDMGLIELARSQGCVLLTEDRALCTTARGANVDCRLIAELLH